MNKLLILPITSILILGCSPNKEAKAIEYDYSDVADLTICWNDILSVESDKYFAYIYSRTCGHCNEIKQDVITYALVNKGALYFVPFNKTIPIIIDRTLPLEKDKVEDLGIVGTPSMFLIVNHVVKENYVGKKEIVKTLTND